MGFLKSVFVLFSLAATGLAVPVDHAPSPVPGVPGPSSLPSPGALAGDGCPNVALCIAKCQREEHVGGACLGAAAEDCVCTA